MKYFDIFGEGGFHSAFMTTYAFGSLAFEDIPFPKLRGAGCRNIIVLADRGMVNQAFADFGPPRFAGTSYHLVKADAPGAFHPKITILIGETKGRLTVGSANLTALGLGGNKEQVASISYSQDSPEMARLFIEALGYLQRYVPDDDPWFPISLQRAMRSAPWLRDDGYPPRFQSDGSAEVNLLFDRPEITLLDQIIASVGKDPIERLVVLSPYWDSRLEGMARLKAGLGNPVTDVLIEQANGFPSSELPRLSDVSLFDVSAIAEGRFLHAKLIVAHGKRWDHVISGSMNCTFPALMGPAQGGNAEAALYKRVARGSALEALGLNNYEHAPLHGEQLAQLQQSFEVSHSAEPIVDGGELILQSGKVSWTAPAKLQASPASIGLQDRDGLALGQIELKGELSATYTVPHEHPRPKHGILLLVDGAISAPIQIVDLDYLAVTTLPAQKGRKKRLMDTLAESIHEDLMLVEALNQLEALEEEDRASQVTQAPRAKQEKHDGIARQYEVLPYEEFVRARTLANAQGRTLGLYLTSRHDKASNLVSACLNQMIALVGPDLSGMEDAEINSLSAIDFRTTEPQSPEDNASDDARTISAQQSKAVSVQSLATAKKFQEAVTAFETRCKAAAGKKITTSETVRLRALTQIILSHAQPISGSFGPSQILPVYTVEGHDWPRLIGRLLLQHFGTKNALQNLTLEPDESEQQRVLEYLALSNWAARAAHRAIISHKSAAALKAPLERIMATLTAQTKATLAPIESDKTYFDQVTANLDAKFENRLGLSN